MKKKKKVAVLGIIVFMIIMSIIGYTYLYFTKNVKEINKIETVSFSKSRGVLAYTINGKKKSDVFPTKDSGYKGESVTCEDGVTAEWNNETWGLVNINSNGNKQIKCTVNFKVPICKRATELHNDGTHTFGKLGSGNTITSGDAFDCDVNGDGEYDANTERFYYVSDYYNTSTKQFESDTAVLIYSHNVSNGKIDDISSHAYSTNGTNVEGPLTNVVELPTTLDWNNVRLKNETRAILNENGESITGGETLKSDFSYSGYAARLITVQEMRQACIINGSGALDKCDYFMENTYYTNSAYANGYWLENGRATNSSHAHLLIIQHPTASEYYHYVTIGAIDFSGLGVRPAIEVSKIDIEL